MRVTPEVRKAAIDAVRRLPMMDDIDDERIIDIALEAAFSAAHEGILASIIAAQLSSTSANLHITAESGGLTTENLAPQAALVPGPRALCADCPPDDYHTDATRCAECPRRKPAGYFAKDVIDRQFAEDTARGQSTCAGNRIIKGLQDAIAGNFERVTIDGQTWVRAPRPMADEVDAIIDVLEDIYKATAHFPIDDAKKLIGAMNRAAQQESDTEAFCRGFSRGIANAIEIAEQADDCHPYEYDAGATEEGYRQAKRHIIEKLQIELSKQPPPCAPQFCDCDSYKDALSDLVHLHSEEWALNGGGPGIAERWKRAWDAASDLVRVEP